MIKFCCGSCSQKVGVNDEGVGRAFHCPTCGVLCVVPPVSAPEFRAEVEAEEMSLAPAPRAAGLAPGTAGQEQLWPHLARCLANWLTQTLFYQRRQLLDAQAIATARVNLLEQRLIVIHDQFQNRVLEYESRIADLEQRLAEAEQAKAEPANNCIPFPAPVTVATHRDAV